MKDLIIDSSLNLTVTNTQIFASGIESYANNYLQGTTELNGTVILNGAVTHTGSITLDSAIINSWLNIIPGFETQGEQFLNNSVYIEGDLYVSEGTTISQSASETIYLTTPSIYISFDESGSELILSSSVAISQYSDTMEIYGATSIYDATSIYGNTEVYLNLDVYGDFTLHGNSIYIDAGQSNNLSITQQEILLNYGEQGQGITSNGGIAGIKLDRGTLPDQQFTWDESIDKFQQKLQDTTYVNIQQQDPIEDEDVVTYGFLQSYTTGGISGTGTLNYISKFQSQNEIQDSIIYELTGKIGINTITPSEQLEVNGNILADSYKSGNYSIEHEPLDDVLDILYSGAIKSYIDQDGQYNGSVILSAGLIVDATQGRLKIPTSQPQSPELGDIWIE